MDRADVLHARLPHRVVAAGGGPLEELVPVIHEALYDEVVGRALLVQCAPQREFIALVGRSEELEADPRACLGEGEGWGEG